MSRQQGYLARGRSDRWHKSPTPLYGGVGVILVFLVAVTLCGPYPAVIVPVSVAFLFGLADDRIGLAPSWKIAGQLLAALCLHVLGGGLKLPHAEFFEFPATALWVVLLANSFNLSDNMDGLAAGLAAMAAFWLAALSGWQSDVDTARLALLLAGSCFGFLLFNFPPASIFMGDCGSQALGVALAALSARLGPLSEPQDLGPRLAPFFAVAVPLFDTLFVTVTRVMRRQSPFQGGRDHVSHRLVLSGLSERRAVLGLYGLAGALTAAAFAADRLGLFGVLGTLMLTTLFGVLFGLFLLGAPERSSQHVGEPRFLEVLLDILICWATFLFAYLLRFGGEIPEPYVRLVLAFSPLIVSVKLLCFLVSGVYGKPAFGSEKLTAVTRGILLGGLASVTLATFLYRFENFPRSVFLIDGALSFGLMLATRAILRIVHSAMGMETRRRRAFFVGGKDVYLALCSYPPPGLEVVGHCSPEGDLEAAADLARTAEADVILFLDGSCDGLGEKALSLPIVRLRFQVVEGSESRKNRRR